MRSSDPLGAEIQRANKRRETPTPRKEPREPDRERDHDARLAERGCEHGDCSVSNPDELQGVETPDGHPLAMVVACDDHEEDVREELADEDWW